MTRTRYQVICQTCGEIEADTDDGLFDEATAHRRAGFHEGAFEHACDVVVAEEIPEFRCPACHDHLVGEAARDDHAREEPGVHPNQFLRV